MIRDKLDYFFTLTLPFEVPAAATFLRGELGAAPKDTRRTFPLGLSVLPPTPPLPGVCCESLSWHFLQCFILTYIPLSLHN